MFYMIRHKILPILPFLALNGVIIIAALFKSLQIGLGYFPIIGLRQVTLMYFKSVLLDHTFQRSIGYSLYLAILSTLMALGLGLYLAFVLAGLRKHRFLARLFEVPITIPHLIVALMMLQLFSQSGLFSRLAVHLGFISQIDAFPLLVHDKFGFSIMMVFLYKEIPYVAVSMLAILRQLNLNYVLVAYNLGATRWQTFARVVLPMIQSTLTTLFIILFCFTFTSFEVPYILGSPGQMTIAVTVYNLFTQADLNIRPEAYALNVLISAICLIVTAVSLLISYRLPGGKEHETR